MMFKWEMALGHSHQKFHNQKLMEVVVQGSIDNDKK
jgi:hypothetical protein